MRTFAALTTAVAATLVAVVGFAGVAAAHVTVNPGSLPQGGFGRVAFRVPNESPTAATTKVEIFLPDEHPIRSVSTMPVPGWTVKVTMRTLDEPIAGGHGGETTEVVSQITWTAKGADNAISQGQFQEFPVSLGPLPETDQLVFKALQTYSDGNVVRWIEEPAEGRELELPAPVLRLAPAGSGGDSAVVVDPVSSTSNEGGGSVLPTVLSVLALLVGLAGLALGALAYRRTSDTRSA
jgi:uncharacterized protein YcnI